MKLRAALPEGTIRNHYVGNILEVDNSRRPPKVHAVQFDGVRIPHCQTKERLVLVVVDWRPICPHDNLGPTADAPQSETAVDGNNAVYVVLLAWQQPYLGTVTAVLRGCKV